MTKVLAITTVSVSLFLLAAIIVLDVYEIDHMSDSEHSSSWLSCKCDNENRQDVSEFLSLISQNFAEGKSLALSPAIAKKLAIASLLHSLVWIKSTLRISNCNRKIPISKKCPNRLDSKLEHHFNQKLNFGELFLNLTQTLKETSVITNSITNIAFYKELMKRKIGARDGKKTDISLLSAFEYPQQINVMITSIAKYGDKIYCRYFDMSMQEIGSPFESVVFPEYTVICLRREGARFMSLSDTFSGQYEYPVPITDRTQSEPTHFFSICLAPIYGTEPKWLHLAEVVEHYKIQGATHFYLYLKYIDEYSRVLLDDYVRTGDAEVIILHDRFVRRDDRWQSMEIQECLNRARGHSRWVAFVDLDERLTPTNYSGTLRSYLENLTDDKIGAVQFQQRWILKNETLPERYTNLTQIDSWMPTRRYHNTSHVGPVGHTAKCIIDPKKVLIMHVHYVDAFFEGYSMYAMRPEEGVVRHYRDINSGQWGKIWLGEVERMGKFSMTNYPAKWANKLLSKVQTRIHYVYGGEN